MKDVSLKETFITCLQHNEECELISRMGTQGKNMLQGR